MSSGSGARSVNGVRLHYDEHGRGTALVISRSFGGWVAPELAVRRPDRVRALALLEPDAPGLSTAADAWVFAFAEGEDGWRSLPDGVRAVFTGNGPALLAELRAYEDGAAGRAALAAVAQPVLLVTAADSPPEFHEPAEALAGALPNARTVLVGGGHIIDPGSPEVVAFIEEVVDAG